MERMNFSEEFKTLRNECAQAIVNLFNQYGITELVLIEDIVIEEYTSANAVKLDNVASSLVNEWFRVHHAESDGCWFTPGINCYEGMEFDIACLYNKITDTIDCLVAKNIPVSDWGNFQIIKAFAETIWWDVEYEIGGKTGYHWGIQGISEEDATNRFNRDNADRNWRIIKISKQEP